MQALAPFISVSRQLVCEPNEGKRGAVALSSLGDGDGDSGEVLPELSFWVEDGGLLGFGSGERASIGGEHPTKQR